MSIDPKLQSTAANQIYVSWHMSVGWTMQIIITCCGDAKMLACNLNLSLNLFWNCLEEFFVFLRHNNIKLSFGTNFFMPINITRTEVVHGYCILIVTHVVIKGNVHNRFVSKIWEIKSIRKSISLLWCGF